MKSHPLGGCWREKRSPPKMGIKAESVAQGGTPGRSSGANPTPTQHGEPPCALQHPPSTKSSQTGTSPSCSRLVASPRRGIWAKMCFVAPGQGPATGGRSHRGARELAARPAGTAAPLGVQTACSPRGCASRLLAPPSTPAGPRKPPAAPGRAAAGQGEPPATPPDYLFPPRSESLSFGERRGSGRERLPATKEAGDRDLTPTEVYLVSARPTTISSLIPSELGSHYSPRDSVNNQYHHNEPGN